MGQTFFSILIKLVWLYKDKLPSMLLPALEAVEPVSKF